jgi:hypothetical protein
MGSTTVDPGTPEPEAKLRVRLDWPNPEQHPANATIKGRSTLELRINSRNMSRGARRRQPEEVFV